MTRDRTPRRYLITRHQDKAQAYISALRRSLWQRTTSVDQAEFMLCDQDIASRLARADRARERGIPLLYYPHAARPPLYWDGIVPAVKHTASFVSAPGHEKVMREFGYEFPVHVTGWTYCPQRPFEATLLRSMLQDRPLRVLFGPIHPNANGWLPLWARKANEAAHTRLLRAAKSGRIDLTVRHIHSLKDNGITPAPAEGFWDGRTHYGERVRYVRVTTGLRYQDIDRADVVVAHQTMAYLAIARGVPTVMIDEGQAPTSGNSQETFMTVASWDKYRDLLAYPLDILQGRTMDVLEEAASSDQRIAAWRDAFIGRPFDDREFVRLVEGYL